MIVIQDKKLAIEKLEKGDYISLEVLRDITGLDPGESSDLYRLAILKLRGQIEEKRRFTMRGEGYSLRILTDPESVYYNERSREHGIKKLTRAYDRAAAIDENNLDELTAKHYRRTLEDHSRILGSVNQAVKEIRSERTAQREPRIHPESTIKIISTNKGTISDGTETNQGNDQGNRAADPA